MKSGAPYLKSQFCIDELDLNVGNPVIQRGQLFGMKIGINLKMKDLPMISLLI